MKTTSGVISLFFSSLFFFLFSFNTTYAEVCVRPELSTCYNTLTSDWQPIDEDNNYIYVQKTTKQVASSCEDFDYNLKMVRYNVCLQINAINAKTENDSLYYSSPQHLKATAPGQDYKQVCPYPKQPLSQATQSVFDRADGDKLTIKKFSDGAYAFFSLDGSYEGIATADEFNNSKEYNNDGDKQLKVLTEMGDLSLLKTIQVDKDVREITIKERENTIRRWLSDKNNCPNGVLRTTLISFIPDPVIFTTDFLPDAVVRQQYSTEIKFIVTGSDTSVIHFSTLSENLHIDAAYVSQDDGSAQLKLTPWQSGKFSILAEAVNRSDVVIGRKVLALNAFNQNEKGVMNQIQSTTTQASLVVNSMTSKTKVSIFSRVLRKGMSGDDVKQLQILLQKLNYLPSTQIPSTYFGPMTGIALMKFQKDNKIQPVTGSFGPATQAKLISLTK